MQLPERSALVSVIIEEFSTEQVPMLLVKDYASAAVHAAGLVG